MPDKILTPRDTINGVVVYDDTVQPDGSMNIIVAPRGRRWQLTAMGDQGASGAALKVFATLSGDDQIKDGNAVWNLFLNVPPGTPTLPDAISAEGPAVTALGIQSDTPASEMPFQIGITVHP